MFSGRLTDDGLFGVTIIRPTIMPNATAPAYLLRNIKHCFFLAYHFLPRCLPRPKGLLASTIGLCIGSMFG
uniref:Uncharacterized protein n=1 Tax=Siphoviridae sp. cttU829 TaxID=2823605 RepID=A0A8S5LC91_9CAUD|nr:MAG TPA: hypothetical protein [Siphoviridae sp. cttU829]